MKKKNGIFSIIAILGVLAIAGCSTSGGEKYLGGGADGKGNGPAPVVLNSAAGLNGGNFVILAKSTVTTTGTTNITGDIGLSPAATSYVTGFGPLTAGSTFATSLDPSAVVAGKIYAADMIPPTPTVLGTAIDDMMTAYVDAAGRALPDFTELYAGDISGRTLAPGLYKWGTGVLINADVTLAGNANDTWIFQIAQDLTMGPGAKVILAGAAVAKNITWQIGGGTGVALNTTSHLEGIVLAKAAVTLQTGATVVGRLMAQTAVTMQANTIVTP